MATNGDFYMPGTKWPVTPPPLTCRGLTVAESEVKESSGMDRWMSEMDNRNR
jgi:hypothetical protein